MRILGFGPHRSFDGCDVLSLERVYGVFSVKYRRIYVCMGICTYIHMNMKAYTLLYLCVMSYPTCL